MRRKQFWKSIIVTGVLAALVAEAVSCQQQFDLNSLPREIAFGVLDEGYGDTKTVSVVTTESINASGFRASATTGSSGSESSVWTDVSFSVNADGFFTAAGDGKWWPAGGDPNYHFYASNVSLTHTAAGATISASNETDVVCAYKETPVYKSVNSLNFSHIFGRLGSVTVQAEEGYTVSNISISITPKTGGTYNIRTGDGKTDATGWSSMTTGSATAIANSSVGTKSNDLYLVPGTYSLTLGWRATRGDYVKDYSGVVKDATIVKGKTNSLTVTLGGQAEQVTFEVSLSAWTSQAHNLTGADFEVPPPPLFSVGESTKVEFASGNLQAVIGSGPTDEYNYTASSWKFAEHQYDYIGNAAGNTSFAVGTTVDLFCWVGESASYDSYGLCTSTSSGYYGNSASDALKTDWGSIPNVISILGTGWRTLTNTEWTYLFTERNNASSLYGQCQITTASGTVTGMLILPDNWVKPSNCTVTPGTGTFTQVTYSATAASGESNAWCDMEAAGAVFLPAAGFRRGLSVDELGTYGNYWSSPTSNANKAYCSYFSSNRIYPQSNSWRYNGFSVRLVQDAN